MSKNETIGSAAAAYADKIDYLVGPRHCAAREGFIAGARWQETQPDENGYLRVQVGYLAELQKSEAVRLAPRMPAVSGVSQTEIMAAIMALGDTVAVIAQTCLKTCDAVAGFRDLHGVMADVGQKVEAVLAVVTEEPEEPEEIDVGGVLHVGVDMAKPGSDKTVISKRGNGVWGLYVDQPEATDQEESEADHWRRRFKHMAQEVEEQAKRAERAERFWRFWRCIARARQEQNIEMGGMIDDLTDQPKSAE